MVAARAIPYQLSAAGASRDLSILGGCSRTQSISVEQRKLDRSLTTEKMKPVVRLDRDRIGEVAKIRLVGTHAIFDAGS